MRLGELLIEAQYLQQSQLELALAEQKRAGGKLGDVLVRLNFVTGAQLASVLALQQGVVAIDLEAVTVMPAALARIPAEVAHDLQVVPLELAENDRLLVVATADVPHGARLEALREVARAWIVPRLVSRSSLVRALERFYGPPRPSLASAEVRALVDLLAERGLLSWDEYLSRLRR